MALAGIKGRSWVCAGSALGQVSLGVYVQQQDFLYVQRKTGPQVVGSGAFANSALLGSVHTNEDMI